jgi:hypothetical protein
MGMKWWILTCAAIAVMAGVGLAGPGWSTSHSLAGGSVTVSNGQANSSWVPVAVMIQYAGATSGTVAVRRVSQGLNVALGVCAFTNVTSVVWVPDSAYAFGCGDALIIGSSETNGLLQLIRRGD